jgi:hypothetical protein
VRNGGYCWTCVRTEDALIASAGLDAGLAVGAQWLALTVAFEFGFGRLVARQSWDELLADYDVRAGRTWPFVLAWIAAGPEVTRRLAPYPLQ